MLGDTGNEGKNEGKRRMTYEIQLTQVLQTISWFSQGFHGFERPTWTRLDRPSKSGVKSGSARPEKVQQSWLNQTDCLQVQKYLI